MSKIIDDSELVIEPWNFYAKESKGGLPNEFVLFSVLGAITPDLDGRATATATLGRRSNSGRLYQKSPGHFDYRKFTIHHMDAAWQIRTLLKLVEFLNAGVINEDLIPQKVASPKAWNKILDLIKPPTIREILDTSC